MMNPNTNRRRFLSDTSALVLGGLTAAASLSARAEESGAPVRVAVVGTGGRGCDLIRALSTTERAEIVAVCDDYEPHLARGSEFAGPQAEPFADYAAMLRKIQPAAVVVAVPLGLHFAMCREALAAGAAVFCEKTMCYSLAEARELAALVEEKQAVFQVGLQRRANAIYAQAAAMVETGMLGQITAIKTQWHRHNNWRRPVPVPRSDKSWSELEQRLNWRLYWRWSQGLVTELASHQLDVASRLLGCGPRRVSAAGGIDYWRDGREVYDNLFCTWEYELPTPSAKVSGHPAGEAGRPYTVRVTWSSLQNNAFEGASEVVMGTRGTLFLTQKKGLFYQEAGVDDPGWTRGEGRVAGDAAVITSGKTLKLENDPWAHRGKPYEIESESDDTRDQLIAFLESVQQNDPATICDVRTGLANTATVLAANESIREGRWVEIPQDLAAPAE